jgi:hypothetical protein
VSSPSPVTVSKLMQLKADAVSHRERLSGIDPATLISAATPETSGDSATRLYVDDRIMELARFVINELGLNLAPMFESAVDAIHEDILPEIGDLQEAVEEILEETGDQLTEETAGLILSVFQQGRAICNHLAEMAKRVDAVTRKRLEQSIKAYRTSETAIRELVQGITLEADAEEGDVGEPAEPGDETATEAPDPEETTEAPAAAAGEEG